MPSGGDSDSTTWTHTTPNIIRGLSGLFKNSNTTPLLILKREHSVNIIFLSPLSSHSLPNTASDPLEQNMKERGQAHSHPQLLQSHLGCEQALPPWPLWVSLPPPPEHVPRCPQVCAPGLQFQDASPLPLLGRGHQIPPPTPHLPGPVRRGGTRHHDCPCSQHMVPTGPLPGDGAFGKCAEGPPPSPCTIPSLCTGPPSSPVHWKFPVVCSALVPQVLHGQLPAGAELRGCCLVPACGLAPANDTAEGKVARAIKTGQERCIQAQQQTLKC